MNPNRTLQDIELPKRFLPALRAMAVLALAREIGVGRVDPVDIKTKAEFLDVVRRLGKTPDDAFEMHIERLPKKLALVRECLKLEEYESAVVLLFTAIEAEVNSIFRIGLRVKGFSHAQATDSIQGVDFKTKLNVLLPLLGVDPSPRLKQIARQSQILRNLEVHFKAQPRVIYAQVSKDGDHSQIRADAKKFFDDNPIENLERDLLPFTDDAISSIPAVQQAILLSKQHEV